MQTTGGGRIRLTALIRFFFMQGWQRFSSAPFSITRIEGNHLWPLQKEPKAAWLEHIAAKLDLVLGV
jgi:hypothetical protein